MLLTALTPAMILYRQTYQLANPDDAPAWLKWMQDVHITSVNKTGLTLPGSGQILHVSECDQKGSTTYEVEYFFTNRDAFTKYREEHIDELKKQYETAGWDDTSGDEHAIRRAPRINWATLDAPAKAAAA